MTEKTIEPPAAGRRVEPLVGRLCVHDPRFSGVMFTTNGCLACELESTQGKVEYQQRRIEALEKVNDQLRQKFAESPMDCLYCGLSKADMAKCVSGFPGCGRADDMMI